MFIDQFIKTLRESVYSDSISRRRGIMMADDLEQRRNQAPKGDGFDIDLTGDDEQDREILAAWIEAGAHAPAMLSPPWGRNFSEDTAVLLRHRLDGAYLDYENAFNIRCDERSKRRAKHEPVST